MKKKSTKLRWLVTMLLLVTAMAMPKMAWAQVTPTKPANGDGTAEKPYEITTAAELAWFRDWVNTCVEGDSHRDACAKLMADIDMSSLCHPADDSKGVAELSWSPISDVAKNNTAPIFMWRGQFDGNGKTISNLYINATSEYQGLFGYGLSNDENIKGVIKNLTLANVNVKNTAGCTGALIGGADNFEITQVVISSGTVEGEISVVGGICGQADTESKFLSCENRAQIKSQTDNTNNIGGICGNVNSSHIEKCANYGNINSQGFDVGGICGYSSISSITTSANYGDIVGNRYVGGIIGYASNASISNSLTTGDVKSITVAAGFVIGCCYNAITLSNTVAYNSGATLTAGKNTHTSAIGDTDSSASVTGSCTAYTTADFNSGHVAWTLNQGSTDGTLVWYQNLSADGRDAYPVLKSTGGNTVYSVKYCDRTGTAYSNSNEAVHRMPEETTLNSEKHIYQKVCKRDGCDHVGYYATSDGKVVANETSEGVFTADEITLVDAKTYDNQAVFTATAFTYNRTFTSTEWTTWYVPFELELTKDICDKYDFSRINNVHQYDDNGDGNADRTVVESFRQNAGVKLKANYPYLVRAKSDADFSMSLPLTNVVPAIAETNSIDCQSVDYKYTFTGTYAGMGDSGSDKYTLCEGNQWLHFYSLNPMRHYLTIESRNVSSPSPASMRSIMLSIVGDEDTTGIVKLYDEERKSSETYDLSGRRLPAGSKPRGLIIENGKVTFKK